VATALAVLLITTVRPVWVWIRLGLLTFAGAVSALVVLGYQYGSSLLITTLGLTGTSLPAALIGMVILAAAVTARPDQAPLRDLDERYDTRLLRTIVPMLAVAPFVPALISAAVTAVLPDAAAAAAVAQLITAAILIGLIAVLGTAQSRARRELLMQRQRVWDAFEQSPAATAIVSLDGRIATANRALVSLTKRPEDALIGTLLPDLISDADHVRMWEAVAEVAAGLDSVRRDVRFRGSGRTSTWVDLTLAAVRDSNDRVIYLILTCTDLSDRKQLERVLSEQAVHDPLTGLLNRIGLDHQIDVLWRSRAPRERVVVVVVDINDLAAVNESLGFAAGDDVLREVSRRLRACTRTEDLLARPSGDEFIVVTTVVTDDPVGTGSVVQRIREELSGPVAAGRDVVPLNVTVGATTLSDLAQILGVWEPGDAPPMLSPTRRATDRSDHR
jgi:diguanylate cyclase (GGDEF)-like protein/PAS domain S-box-containing protein